MLPPFIIEQIRRRERREQARREGQQPRVEIPVDIYPPAPESGDGDEKSENGFVILEL